MPDWPCAILLFLTEALGLSYRRHADMQTCRHCSRDHHLGGHPRVYVNRHKRASSLPEVPSMSAGFGMAATRGVQLDAAMSAGLRRRPRTWHRVRRVRTESCSLSIFFGAATEQDAHAHPRTRGAHAFPGTQESRISTGDLTCRVRRYLSRLSGVRGGRKALYACMPGAPSLSWSPFSKATPQLGPVSLPPCDPGVLLAMPDEQTG